MLIGTGPLISDMLIVMPVNKNCEASNAIAFGKAPRREADRQPISQSVSQSVSH